MLGLLSRKPVPVVRDAFLSVLTNEQLDQWCSHPFILEAIIKHSLCTKQCSRWEKLCPVYDLGVIVIEHGDTSQILIGILPFQLHLSWHLLPVFWGLPSYLWELRESLIAGERLPQHTNDMDKMFKCWPMDVIFRYSKLLNVVGFNTSK